MTTDEPRMAAAMCDGCGEWHNGNHNCVVTATSAWVVVRGPTHADPQDRVLSAHDTYGQAIACLAIAAELHDKLRLEAL